MGSGLPSSIVSDALEWAAHSGRGGKEAIICAASGNSGSQWIRVSVTLPETESNVAFAVAAYAGEVIYLDAVEVPGAAFQGFEGAAFPPAPVTTTVQTPGWMNDGWTRQTGTFPNVFSGNAAARFVGQSLANGNPRTGSLSYTFPNGVSGGTVTFRFRVTSTSAAGLSSFSGILLTDGFQKFWPPGGQLSEFAYFGRELGASGLDAAVQSHKDVIAVGASSNIDAPSFFTQSGSGLDFLAPGGSQHFGNTTTPARIFTSDRTGADGYVAGDIVQVSGTSFASPLTAGAAALLLSRDSNLPGILVRDLLRAGCEKVGVPEYVYSGDVPFGGSYNSEYGFGRLSIARSMQHLVSSQSFPASSSTGWAASTFGFASGHKTWRFPALGGYAVSAPGAFDWIASSDRLCFVRQAFYSGNCQIIARVGGVSGAANLAAGGVMVRTGFSGGGPFVFVGLRRDGGITFASRNQGAATFSNTLSGQASPLWVRITTTATAISASTSNNGTTWTSAGSISGSFSGYKEIGLTAVNRETFPDTTPVHATFDRVSVFGPLNIYTKAGSSLGYLDSSSTLAKFSQPSGVCTDNAGTIYVADTGNHRIRKIAAGAVSSIAGRGVAGSFTAPSNASVASLNSPKDVGLDTEGRLYVLDSGNHCIRRMVLATGVVSTFAGTPTQGGFLGDGGPASAAKFSNPTGFSLDIDGNIYVADTGNNRIRRIDARTEIVTTVAGGGSTLGDGALAVNAMLVAPRDVAVDVYGGMYVADAGQFRVRKIDLNSGVITTLAGTGVTGYSGNNGAATAAKLGTVNGIAVDDAGNVWFSDVFNAANHRVRRVSYPSGTISAVAGVGTAGFTGDNASGVAAQINTPFGITLDDAGDLIFADSENNRIRRVK